MKTKKITIDQLYGFPGVATYSYEKATDIFGVYNRDEELVATFAVIDKDNGCYLFNLLVHPYYRGQGIGKYIMKRIIKKRGTALGFNVEIHNTEAIAMYLKAGFKISAVNPTAGKLTFYYS